MLINKDKLIHMIADRGQFTLGDSKIFLNTLIGILEDVVLNRWEFKVGGFGILRFTEFKGGQKDMPISGIKNELVEKTVSPSERIYFSLSENITRKSRIRLRAEEELDL